MVQREKTTWNSVHLMLSHQKKRFISSGRRPDSASARRSSCTWLWWQIMMFRWKICLKRKWGKILWFINHQQNIYTSKSFFKNAALCDVHKKADPQIIRTTDKLGAAILQIWVKFDTNPKLVGLSKHGNHTFTLKILPSQAKESSGDVERDKKQTKTSQIIFVGYTMLGRNRSVALCSKMLQTSLLKSKTDMSKNLGDDCHVFFCWKNLCQQKSPPTTRLDQFALLGDLVSQRFHMLLQVGNALTIRRAQRLSFGERPSKPPVKITVERSRWQRQGLQPGSNLEGFCKKKVNQWINKDLNIFWYILVSWCIFMYLLVSEICICMNEYVSCWSSVCCEDTLPLGWFERVCCLTCVGKSFARWLLLLVFCLFGSGCECYLQH